MSYGGGREIFKNFVVPSPDKISIKEMEKGRRKKKKCWQTIKQLTSLYLDFISG